MRGTVTPTDDDRARAEALERGAAIVAAVRAQADLLEEMYREAD